MSRFIVTLYLLLGTYELAIGLVGLFLAASLDEVFLVFFSLSDVIAGIVILVGLYYEKRR